MKITLDAYWLISGPPSGRNILRSLIRSWLRNFTEDTITLVVRPDEVGAVRSIFPEDNVKVLSGSRLPHGLAIQLLAFSVRHDEFLFVQNFAPIFRRKRTTVFVHDAMFVENPSWFTWRERLYLGRIRSTLRSANVILTSSNSEKTRIARVWPETSTKVHAVGLAPPLSLLGSTPKKPSFVGVRPFILSVGRFNERKNLGRLVEAYLASKLRLECDLILVGPKDGKAPSDLRGSSKTARQGILFAGEVSEPELSWLYANTRSLVFPSLDEGFGLPITEAHYFNTPCISSDIDVFHELSLSREYFNPMSIADITRALDGLLKNTARPTKQGPNVSEVLEAWAALVTRIRSLVWSS